MSESATKKKICLLGFYGVGKTSLVRRFVHTLFDEKYHVTLGVKVDTKAVAVNGQDMTLSIWDIAGAEDYFAMPMNYVRGSAGYLLVIDSTNPKSLDRGLDIVRQVDGEIGVLPRVVLLNKIDLTEQFALTDDLLAPISAMNCPVIRSSAKTGQGVEEAFLELSKRMSR